MTAVDNALIEIDAALTVLSPQLEGLRDYSRLNLHPDTQVVIGQAIADYVRRESLLLTAQANLTALVTDDYPALDIREVAQLVYADLQDNAATIEAALAKFSPNTAATLLVTSGAPEPKA